MGRTETPGQYSRRTKSLLARNLRNAIDAADRKGSTDVAPEAALMVAEDAKQEQRPDAMVEALAQIPPFVVGRTKYRVIGERTIDAGKPTERKEIALLCRSRSSMLHEHPNGCICTACIDRSSDRPRVWYHDASGTYHVRNPDGTFTKIDAPGRAWHSPIF